jgi:hypothetical protein
MNIEPSIGNAKVSELEKEHSKEFLKSIFDSVQASIFVVDVTSEGDFHYFALNPTYEKSIGICSEDIRGKTPEEVLLSEDAKSVRQHYNDCVRFGKNISYEECLTFQGIPSWWITTLTPLHDADSNVYRLIGTSTNITERKLTEEALRVQTEREQILSVIASNIRQSLDLDIILQRTVTEVRQFLLCDRVLVYRFLDDGSGNIVVESVLSPWSQVLAVNIKDPCFTQKHIQRYKKGQIQVVEDIYNSGLHPCYIQLLASLQVRANLVVPIISEQNLWGLLIAQHCSKTRQWYQTEIDLLKQLANQVGIAVQQAELHASVQRLNVELEYQVEQRTLELQKALDFEALVRRITEKIRDSLDETQVLQTACEELAEVLEVERCKIEIYSSCQTTASIAYEYTTTLPLCQGITRCIADFPEVYQPLLQKQSLQFREVVQTWNPDTPLMTRLACPIFDDRGIIGNLWLIRKKEEAFDEFEIKLVQLFANECAIAIRQARLYQACQLQVTELEKLDKLKNDFLKTLSHELRSPITSINLAAQTLEAVLKKAGVDSIKRVAPLLQTLRSECQRETKLINDLLTLTYLEAETESVTLVELDLQSWLPAIVESYKQRISNQQQQLNITLEPVPILQTDITDLERVVTELLNNACKYTPVGGLIAVAVSSKIDTLEISVSNTGVEIPSTELLRIFEPFYRIPNQDPWKYGGIGLGLALVQKLVQRLGGQIQVSSDANNTTFIVRLFV